MNAADGRRVLDVHRVLDVLADTPTPPDQLGALLRHTRHAANITRPTPGERDLMDRRAAPF